MNSITDLRTHLFETMAALRDKENPMDVERARAVSEIAQTLINSAKVECDFMRMRGENSKGTGFIPDEIQAPNTPRLVKGTAHSGSR